MNKITYRLQLVPICSSDNKTLVDEDGVKWVDFIKVEGISPMELTEAEFDNMCLELKRGLVLNIKSGEVK